MVQTGESSMKLKLLGAALAAAAWCSPATSALVITGEATGFSLTRPGCVIGQPTTACMATQTVTAVTYFVDLAFPESQLVNNQINFSARTSVLDGTDTFSFGAIVGGGFSIMGLNRPGQADIEIRATGPSFTLINDPSRTSFTFRISGVPEPSTWAMMLIGFGAVGSAMRKRPKVHAQLT
jgi:hypothetical protein